MKARFCSVCGKERVDDGTFCWYCGDRFEEETTVGGETSATKEVPVNHFSDQVKGVFLQATEKVNSMVGEKGNIDLKLRDVFSAVLKKHSKEEGEVLFITGTSLTTPDESEISASWPKPWLFSRVFLILASTYLLLYICTFTFQNDNAVPGLMMIGQLNRVLRYISPITTKSVPTKNRGRKVWR
ncbi:hypothetical protein CR203_06535 [Salipaludibacillus neizhouensis]|uniref:Uncharacterized protein n=1 Tax=Salipaludibacillus neizhouensis TaxID=885475 RepID=A0A3A9K6C6_9BACI|nr:hypothetical protein [Salipaludibacillus neizhouensis]RKL68137.1 hypothetical protein CR203_06535 [Salipaludibacillus neizhouensis]